MLKISRICIEIEMHIAGNHKITFARSKYLIDKIISPFIPVKYITFLSLLELKLLDLHKWIFYLISMIKKKRKNL